MLWFVHVFDAGAAAHDASPSEINTYADRLLISMAGESEKSASQQSPATVRFAEFELDLRTGELRKRGLRLRLPEQSFQVLAMLVARPGELVTREELRQKLWPADTFVDFDHGLNAAVNKLREALADSASTPRFIETLPKRGYRFLFPLSTNRTGATETDINLPSTTPPAEDSDTPAEPIPRPSRALSRSLFALAQAMYLAFYIAALANASQLDEAAAGIFGRASTIVAHIAVITAITGIPARLYLLSATAFDVRALGPQFRRLFPALFLWDALWALSPLLLWRELGDGLALAAMAALMWMPFAQRTLMRMAYPSHPAVN